MPWLRKAASRRRPCRTRSSEVNPLRRAEQRRVVRAHVAVGVEDLVEEAVDARSPRTAQARPRRCSTGPRYRPVALTGDEQLQREGHDDGDAARQREQEQCARLHRSGRVAALSSGAMTTPAGGAGPEGERLVVVGQGYVGLPLAMRAAEVGYEVVGFDVDATRIKRLEAGESPVEDVGDERLRAALDAGRYRPTADPGRARRASTSRSSRCRRRCARAAPTCPTSRTAAADAGARAAAGATVVLESTTYPGTTEELVLPDPRGRLRPGRRRRLPPRLQPRAHRPGQHRRGRFENTPKVVSGIDAGLARRGRRRSTTGWSTRPCRCRRPARPS